MSRRSQDVAPARRAPYDAGADTDERFRAALAASLDAVVLCETLRDDFGGFQGFRVVEANAAAATLLDVPLDHLVGSELAHLVPADERARIGDRCRHVVESGEAVDEILDVRERGMAVDWIHAQVVRVGDGILATIRDVSGQTRALEALRRSEERHREIVERASDGIYRIDTFGVFTFANPIVARILGLGPDSVLGRNYLEFVRRDYQEHGIALYKRQIRELIPVTYWEFPAVTADGREVWIGQKVHAEIEGRWVTGLFAVARDITERKRVELALRESEERYRFLAEQSADMLSRHSPDGTFRYASRAVQPLLGYAPEELPGVEVASLAHPDDAAAVRAAHMRMLGHFGMETVTFRARRRDGSHVWLETTTHAIRDPEHGEVIEVLMVSRDVTGRQDREARLRRTESLDAMARLAGDVGEALESVLRPLLQAADLLRRDAHDGGDASPAVVAWQQSNALADLAARLRAVGRRDRVLPELVDVNALVCALDPVVKRIAGDLVTVRLVLDPSVPAAFTDPGQLEAALLELARNAGAAMPQGGTLVIETFARDGNSAHGTARGVAIRVRDTGIGIPAPMRERLFEPYPLGVGQRGAGLGLAAVHGVLAQGGAELTVEPAPGGGTLATIHLPER